MPDKNTLHLSLDTSIISEVAVKGDDQVHHATLLAANERLEDEIDGLYGKVDRLEGELRESRDMKKQLEAVKGQRDALVSECGILSTEVAKEKRRTDAAVSKHDAVVRDHANSIADFAQEKEELQRGMVDLRQQLSLAASNETALSDKLAASRIALQALETDQARLVETVRTKDQALQDAETQVETLLQERDNYREEAQAQWRDIEERLEYAKQELADERLVITKMMAERHEMRCTIAKTEPRLESAEKEAMRNQDWVYDGREAIARLNVIIKDQKPTKEADLGKHGEVTQDLNQENTLLADITRLMHVIDSNRSASESAIISLQMRNENLQKTATAAESRTESIMKDLSQSQGRESKPRMVLGRYSTDQSHRPSSR